MKKILLLGGSSQQVIAIETAKKMGHYTILCDYLEDNPGQYIADKFYLASTTDKELILSIARDENIDGILAYASDPAAPTAAYVAEELGLPTNPYKSVDTLCNKGKFRKFLSENNFNVPKSFTFKYFNETASVIDKLELPVIVKPVDSSGSKGITVLDNWHSLHEAFDFALSFSRTKTIIIEEFIIAKHKYLVGGDIFVINGKVQIWGLMNCHRDNIVNRLVPVGKSYPLELNEYDIKAVKDVLKRIVKILGITNGAMNVELMIDSSDKVYAVDIGPRSGGNMIPDLMNLIFNVNIVELSIKFALGEIMNVNNNISSSFYATHNLHSSKNGIYNKVIFSSEIERFIIKKCLYKNYGANVNCFSNASDALGILFLKFDSRGQMNNILENINKHVKVVLKENK